MLFLVTINEGMGRIRCPFPSFTLDEERKKSVLVHERTEQLKGLEDEGIVTITIVTEGQYDEMLAKVSARLTKKAIAAERAVLNRLIKTGGKSKVITGSGLTMTVEPGDATPEEIAAEAKQRLEALNAQVGEESSSGPGEEPPVDDIAKFLRQNEIK